MQKLKVAMKDGVFFGLILTMMLISPLVTDRHGYGDDDFVSVGWTEDQTPAWLRPITPITDPVILLLNWPGTLIGSMIGMWLLRMTNHSSLMDLGLTETWTIRILYFGISLGNAVFYSIVSYCCRSLRSEKKTETDLLADEIFRSVGKQTGEKGEPNA